MDVFDGLDLAAALGIDAAALEQQPEPAMPEPLSVHIALHTGARHFWKKAKGPEVLAADIHGWPFDEGDCYHCMTIGMVDSLTWLRLMMDLQTAKYIAVSTYALFEDAVGDMFKAWERGRFQRIDFYLGDNVRDRHPETYRRIKELLPNCGGRLVVFQNHTKVIAIEGDRFDVLIESSANMNERLIPHFEQTCITVSHDLVRHTIDTLAEIHPANKETFAEPYRMEADKDGREPEASSRGNVPG